VGVAPKADARDEDDAWIVTFTTDPANDVSECLVLDGRRISDGPVARLRLPERISSGTHAAWAPGAELPA
jgi:carotenoid cleavage dioxygenase